MDIDEILSKYGKTINAGYFVGDDILALVREVNGLRYEVKILNERWNFDYDKAVSLIKNHTPFDGQIELKHVINLINHYESIVNKKYESNPIKHF